VFERSRRPLIAKASFEPGPVRVRFVAEEVAMEHGFLQVLRFPPVTIIPPMLYIHLHFNTTQFRKTSGRSVGSLKRSSALSDIWGALDRKVSSRCYSLHRVKMRVTLFYWRGTEVLRSLRILYTAVILLLVAWWWQHIPKIAIQNELNTDAIYGCISIPIPSCPIFSTVLDPGLQLRYSIYMWCLYRTKLRSSEMESVPFNPNSVKTRLNDSAIKFARVTK